MGLVIVLVASGVAWAKPSGDRGPKAKKCDAGGAMHASCEKPDVRAPKPKKEKRVKEPKCARDDESCPPGKKGKTERGPSCDEEAVAMVLAEIDALCPCEGRTDDDGEVMPWRNHGKYVSCVTKARRKVLRSLEDPVPNRCLRNVVPCASRSTCGRREGVVACTVAAPSCVDGFCSNDSMLSCEAAKDCGGGRDRCWVSTSVEMCEKRGGVAGVGSCCDPQPLGSPSGAFVDGILTF